MRIFTNCNELMSETFRDVREMGVEHTVQSMQDKQKPFLTREVINYSYMLQDVGSEENTVSINALFEITKAKDWADAEFYERISYPSNPGHAWNLRADMWTQYMQKNNGKFAYTYSERIYPQLAKIITELINKPGTRQAILSIWNPEIDNGKMGDDRVPCSMYYQFLIRDRKLHIIYDMRSCDIAKHFGNDVYLALRMQEHVCSMIKMNSSEDIQLGNFYHNIKSFHVYEEDFYLL